MLIKRVSNVGSDDLHVVYRPCLVSEIVGQETNRNILKGYLDNNTTPHTQLFTGPSGCGKTTAARIVALGLNCKNSDKPTSTPCLECSSCRAILNYSDMDVQEINVGETGGKEAVTRIVKDLPYAPYSSRFKILIFDEAHKLTTDAKDLLLKKTEDGYRHVYYIFCTNEPEKLMGKKTDENPFLGRCSIMHFGRISSDLLKDMIQNVAEFEGMDYNDEVLQFIADEAKGVPREALVKLNQVDKEGSWTVEAAKQITGILVDEDNPQVIALSKLLIAGKWLDSIKMFDKLKNNLPVESLRVAVQGYFVGCLKRSTKVGEGKKFDRILTIIDNPIYVTGKMGEYRFYQMMFQITDIINSSRRLS